MYAGKLEEAVGHFINFVHFSGDPQRTLMMLQQSMPAPLFNIIVRAYAAIQEERRGTLGQGSRTNKARKEEDMD